MHGALNMSFAYNFVLYSGANATGLAEADNLLPVGNGDPWGQWGTNTPNPDITGELSSASLLGYH